MILPDDAVAEDLQDLYEHAPCGYLSMSADGKVIKINSTLCGWLGKSSDQIIGRRFRDLLNVAGSIFYETHFSPLLRMQGYFNEVALDLVTADRTILPVLANATERHDAQGQLIYTRLVLFRATERRRYERELVDARSAERDARAKLQDLVDALQLDRAEQIAASLADRQTAEFREQFIAVLGHDLRNPVAAIEAGIKMLAREDKSEKSARVLQLMRGSVMRMNGLIDNVLDLARSRLGGGISLALDADQALGPILELVVEEIRTANPGRDIVATLELPPALKVDHQRIAQMLSNLLGNAVSHGAEDAPIRIHGGINPEGALELSVANSGEPIPQAMMEHLFKPFHRGEIRNNAEGLGLGLYIASQIAEAHGGQLGVTSDSTETRFIFRMPV